MSGDKPGAAADPVGRQGRLVAVVIALTLVGWVGGQWLGARFGWDARYVFLFDFAALAAFFWALVVTYRIWRLRQKNQG